MHVCSYNYELICVLWTLIFSVTMAHRSSHLSYNIIWKWKKIVPISQPTVFIGKNLSQCHANFINDCVNNNYYGDLCCIRKFSISAKYT